MAARTILGPAILLMLTLVALPVASADRALQCSWSADGYDWSCDDSTGTVGNLVYCHGAGVCRLVGGPVALGHEWLDTLVCSDGGPCDHAVEAAGFGVAIRVDEAGGRAWTITAPALPP